MKIISVNGKEINTDIKLFEFEKMFKNSDKYIILYDVWYLENGKREYKEAMQIEKNRIKYYG